MEIEMNTAMADAERRSRSPSPPPQSYGGGQDQLIGGGDGRSKDDDGNGRPSPPPPPPPPSGTADDGHHNGDAVGRRNGNDDDGDEDDGDDTTTPTRSHFRCLTCRVKLLPPPTVTDGDGTCTGDGDGRTSASSTTATAAGAAAVVVPHPLLLTPSCRDCALAAAAVEGAVRAEEVGGAESRRRSEVAAPGDGEGGGDAAAATPPPPSWKQDACSWCARREEEESTVDDDGDGGGDDLDGGRATSNNDDDDGFGEISSPPRPAFLDALDKMQTDGGGGGGEGVRAIEGEGDNIDGEEGGNEDGDKDEDEDDEVLPSTLFLCDRCPRAFCFECICRAHLVAPPSSSSSSSSPSPEDGEKADGVDEEEEEEERIAFRRELGLYLKALPEFECPACSAPEGLRRLRLGPRLRLLRTGIAPFPPGDDDEDEGDDGDDEGGVGRGVGASAPSHADGGGGAVMSDDDEEEDYPPILKLKKKKNIPSHSGTGVPPTDGDGDGDGDGAGDGDGDGESDLDGDAEDEVARRVATLSNLEDRLEACQSRLESSSLERREAELRRRRGLSAPQIDGSDGAAGGENGGGNGDEAADEAERRIRVEMEAYVSTWEDRCEAIEDAIPPAQDALEDAGVSLEAFYYGYRRSRGKKDGGGDDGLDGAEKEDGDGEEEEEAWRRAADEALNKRDLEEGFRAGEFKGSHGYKPKNPLVYRLDPPCDWSSEDDEDDDDDDSEADGGGTGGRASGGSSRAIIERSDESVRRNFEIVDDIQSLDAAIDVRLTSPGRTGRGERNCWSGAVAAQLFDGNGDDNATAMDGDDDEGGHMRRLFRKALRAEDRRWEGVASRTPSERTVAAPRIRRKHVGGKESSSNEDGGGETIPGRRDGVFTVGHREGGPNNGSRKDGKRIAPTLLVGKGQRYGYGSPYKKLRLFPCGSGGGRRGGGAENGDDGADVDPLDMNGEKPPAAEEAPLPTLPRPVDPDSLTSGFPHSDLVLNEAEARRQSSAAKVDGAAAARDGGAPPPAPVGKVSVAKPLADALKPHQREGVQFMWNLVCGSVGMVRNHPPWTQHGRDDEVRGCILAHNMGLGKSLQSVAVIHTLLCHPELYVPTYEQIGDDMSKEADAQTGLPQSVHDKVNGGICTTKMEDTDNAEKGEGDPPMEIRRRRIFKRILLCVPVNTLTNWENEFITWIGRCDEGNEDGNGEGRSTGEDLAFSPVIDAGPIRIYCPNKVIRGPGRNQIVQTWYQYGGVLLTSFEMLRGLVKNAFDDYNKPAVDLQTEGEVGSNDSNKRMAIILLKALQSPGPDLVVVDEAHQALKKSTTGISKVLYGLQTTRRIALTGTPFQNNLLEYYCMSNWVMPGCLGEESKFERQFVFPIMNGIRADSTPEQVDLQQRKTRKLYRRLLPFVHRKDSKILTDDLPMMQQAVIVVRQTKLQGTLYRAFKRYQKAKDSKNFLEAYGKMRPIFNHPGCLLHRTSKPSQPMPSAYAGDYDGANGRNEDSTWWQPTYARHPDMASIEHGGKMMLLIQILVHADLIGEKVVVFSQCLKTLDYIESILNMPHWEQNVTLLNELSPGKSWGPWRKNSEYLRIDGGTTASTRGELVSSFNALKSKTMLPKLFLISTKAGGIGINLVAANRVVIFDSHWNPAVDLQALYRCYRYGQTRPVYAYRFLAEGTMEEKIYSRQVNKSSLAERVIDRNNPLRAFTEAELENLMDNNTWVQCDSCNKWRMLPPDADADELPDKWFCYMNVHDRDRSDCHAEEKDQRFYLEFFRQQYVPQKLEMPPDDFRVARDATADGGGGVTDGKEESTARDIILDSILSKAKEKVSKHHFHDTLLEDHGGDDQDTMAIVDEGAVIDITEEEPDKSQGSNPVENHGIQGNSRVIPPEQHMIPLINLGHAGMVANQSQVSQAMAQLARPHADENIGQVSTTEDRKHAITQGGRPSANVNADEVIDLLSSDDEI